MKYRPGLFIVLTLAWIITLSCAFPVSLESLAQPATPPPPQQPSAPIAAPATSAIPSVSVPANAIIVDNAGAGFAIQAGDWGTCRGNECSGKPYGADFRYADPTCPTCRARFELKVATAGSYEVFVWWPHGGDRATDTPFTIQAASGTHVIKVDQRNSGDDWFWLVTLNAQAGETITITVGGTKTGFANADAVALFPSGVAPQAQPPSAPTAATRAQPTQVAAPQPTTARAQPTQAAAPQPTAPSQAANRGARKIIFLHHSTGQGLIEQGNVRQRLTALGYEFYDHGYNGDGLTLANGQAAGMDFDIPDDNTDPDGLNTLFAQPLHTPPDNAFSRLLQYDVIAFKSCFPTSDIQSDAQLAEYKTYYRNIRTVIDRYPQKIFIAVTPPPNVPNATSREAAARARAWVNWLKSPEFLSGHPNLFTFDFFNLLAESNTGARDYNMLRAAYRADPNDSHPNERANREIGPQFADFVAQAIKTFSGK